MAFHQKSGYQQSDFPAKLPIFAAFAHKPVNLGIDKKREQCFSILFILRGQTYVANRHIDYIF
jgi:hypothetical protein